MRSRSAFVLVTTLVGCSAGTVVPSYEQAEPPDAQVVEPPAPDATVTPPPAVPSFQIVAPTVDVAPAQEITYCYYFHTPNTSDLSIKKWASHMTPGAHDMIVYLTQSDLQTAGSLSTERCGFIANGIGPVWAYSAQSADDEAALPADDGNGMPVGLPLRAGRSGFIQMHFINTTADVLHAHVELYGFAYDDGVQVTPAGSFYTYSTKIDLASGSAATPTTGMVNGQCDVSPDAKFFLMSAHTHKQGVHSFVKDAATMVFDTTNWEHPGVSSWSATPFYAFTSGKLSWQCEYVNPNNYRIQFGDDPARAEICAAVGYFFPSPGGAGLYCQDSVMVN
jgi:hypothetical protein